MQDTFSFLTKLIFELQGNHLIFLAHQCKCCCVSRYVTISSLVFSMDSQFLCASSNTETVHIFKLEHLSTRSVQAPDRNYSLDRRNQAMVILYYHCQHKRFLPFLNAMNLALFVCLPQSSDCVLTKPWCCNTWKHKIWGHPPEFTPRLCPL